MIYSKETNMGILTEQGNQQQTQAPTPLSLRHSIESEIKSLVVQIDYLNEKLIKAEELGLLDLGVEDLRSILYY